MFSLNILHFRKSDPTNKYVAFIITKTFHQIFISKKIHRQDPVYSNKKHFYGYRQKSDSLKIIKKIVKRSKKNEEQVNYLKLIASKQTVKKICDIVEYNIKKNWNQYTEE